MQISFLIEPIEGSRFRAQAGEPLGIRAEGDTRDEALQTLQHLIDQRLRNGAELGVLNVPNGAAHPVATLPFRADDAYKTDWVYRELQEAIAEERRAEETAGS
jgi:Ser-tRNA(Ala) deacylase AlaX